MHVWKYAALNTAFSCLTLATYGIFPGGGEGARARALMITIFHFGFCVWGVLLWSKLPDCVDVIENKFFQIYVFHMVCIWHNAIFLIMYVSHELYLGDKVGGDLTLMPEVGKHEIVHDYSYTGITPLSPQDTPAPIKMYSQTEAVEPDRRPAPPKVEFSTPQLQRIQEEESPPTPQRNL
jgi:hypothetical protein